MHSIISMSKLRTSSAECSVQDSSLLLERSGAASVLGRSSPYLGSRLGMAPGKQQRRSPSLYR